MAKVMARVGGSTGRAASGRVTAWPLPSLIAWAMVYGTIFNVLLALWLSGPPVVDSRPGYWLGLVYLGVVGSAVAFSLYFAVIRAVGLPS